MKLRITVRLQAETEDELINNIPTNLKGMTRIVRGLIHDGAFGIPESHIDLRMLVDTSNWIEFDPKIGDSKLIMFPSLNEVMKQDLIARLTRFDEDELL